MIFIIYFYLFIILYVSLVMLVYSGKRVMKIIYLSKKFLFYSFSFPFSFERGLFRRQFSRDYPVYGYVYGFARNVYFD